MVVWRWRYISNYPQTAFKFNETAYCRASTGIQNTLQCMQLLFSSFSFFFFAHCSTERVRKENRFLRATLHYDVAGNIIYWKLLFRWFVTRDNGGSITKNSDNNPSAIIKLLKHNFMLKCHVIIILIHICKLFKWYIIYERMIHFRTDQHRKRSSL